MLRRKKKEEPQPEPQEETPVVDVNQGGKEEEKKEKELTPEEKKQLEILQRKFSAYNNEFGNVFVPQHFYTDMASAEICNLLFGIFSEVKEMKQEIIKIRQMNEEG